MARNDGMLWLICHVDGDVIEGEVAIGIARHIDDAHPEVRVAEVARCPRAAPGVCGTAENVGGFNSTQCDCLLGGRPRRAAVP